MNPSESRCHATQIDVRIDKSTQLPGRAWCAERPRALIAIVHGLGEHAGRYGALASALVDRRFTVVSLDLPGHGEAAGPRGDAPSWIGLRDLVIPAMFTVTRGMPGQPPDLPVVLLGHSMGGLLALDYALAHPKSLLGLVLSAPALKSNPPPGWKVALARMAKVIAPTVGFPTASRKPASRVIPRCASAARTTRSFTARSPRGSISGWSRPAGASWRNRAAWRSLR